MATEAKKQQEQIRYPQQRSRPGPGTLISERWAEEEKPAEKTEKQQSESEKNAGKCDISEIQQRQF